MWCNRTAFPHRLACSRIIHCAVDNRSYTGAPVLPVYDHVTMVAKRFAAAGRTTFIYEYMTMPALGMFRAKTISPICMFGSILPDSIARAEIPSRCTDLRTVSNHCRQLTLAQNPCPIRDYVVHVITPHVNQSTCYVRPSGFYDLPESVSSTFENARRTYPA